MQLIMSWHRIIPHGITEIGGNGLVTLDTRRCSRRRSGVWLLWLLLLLGVQQTWTIVGFYRYTTKTANGCFSVAGVPRLDLEQCTGSEKILIREAFQGIASTSSECYYHHEDCVEPTTTHTDSKLHDKCMGRSACSVTVGLSWMRRCNAYSTYNSVIYQCIQEDEILDICSTQKTSAFRMGFIKSPGYPNTYPSDQRCQCNITTKQDQKILLRFADSSLEWSEECSNDVVRITDGTDVMTRCGKLPRNYNITSHTNQLQVDFRSNHWQQLKGFWIIVEALDTMELSCGRVNVLLPTTTLPPSEPTLPPTDPTLTTTDLPQPTLNYGQHEVDDDFLLQPDFAPDDSGVIITQHDLGKEHDKDFIENDPATTQLSTLISIIVGCVLLCILILVIVFLIIWFKKRTHTEQISKGEQDGQAAHLHRHNPRNTSFRHPRPTPGEAPPTPSIITPTHVLTPPNLYAHGTAVRAATNERGIDPYWPTDRATTGVGNTEAASRKNTKKPKVTIQA